MLALRNRLLQGPYVVVALEGLQVDHEPLRPHLGEKEGGGQAGHGPVGGLGELEGRPGQEEAMVRLDPPQHLEEQGLVVLEPVGLVHHDVGPSDFLEESLSSHTLT